MHDHHVHSAATRTENGAVLLAIAHVRSSVEGVATFILAGNVTALNIATGDGATDCATVNACNEFGARGVGTAKMATVNGNETTSVDTACAAKVDGNGTTSVGTAGADSVN